MAKNVPKTTANTENNVYNQHKTTTCRITDEAEKNENTEPEKLLYVQQAQEFYHEPIENENSVFALIASGDINQLLESKLKYDADIESGKGQLSDDPLRNQIYHLVVCAAVVARTCIAAGMSEETAYTLSDIYIRRADICTSIEQVIELNNEMVMDYAVRMQRLRRTKRLSVPVRTAIKMISENTGKRLTVQQIADEAGYDRSHLHRLFKAEIGMGILIAAFVTIIVIVFFITVNDIFKAVNAFFHIGHNVCNIVQFFVNIAQCQCNIVKNVNDSCKHFAFLS
jgi:AraC-like DNA-binding protein